MKKILLVLLLGVSLYGDACSAGLANFNESLHNYIDRQKEYLHALKNKSDSSLELENMYKYKIKILDAYYIGIYACRDDEEASSFLMQSAKQLGLK